MLYVCTVICSNWWLPLKWSTEILEAAREDLISNQPGYAGLLAKLGEFRAALTDVATYGHIPVPLVYSQVFLIIVITTNSLYMNVRW